MEQGVNRGKKKGGGVQGVGEERSRDNRQGGKRRVKEGMMGQEKGRERAGRERNQ